MLGILFDIGKLGEGFYGYAAFQIFFDALDTRQLLGCSLYHGDTNATLHGSANEYCIAIASRDETKIDLVRNAFWAYHAKGLLPLPIRFLEHDQVSQEPLIEAGFIIGTELFGDTTGWITKALGKSQKKHEKEMK
jgi:hypothetical protein